MSPLLKSMHAKTDKPKTRQLTFGWRRTIILAALSLLVLALAIFGNMGYAWLDGDTRRGILICDGAIQWSSFPHWPYRDLKPRTAVNGWSVSLFSVAAILAALPLAQLLDVARVKLRESMGDRTNSEPLCGHCKYNLTGNTSGVCPECGIAISPTLKEIVK